MCHVPVSFLELADGGTAEEVTGEETKVVAAGQVNSNKFDLTNLNCV